MLVVKLILSFLFPLYFVALKFRTFIGQSRVIVLTLHEIDEKNRHKVTSLLEFLRRHFGFIDPIVFERFLNGEEQLKGVKFLLTFDDGFNSSAEFGLSSLKGLGIKAVFFVCPDYISLSEGSVSEVKSFIKNNLFLGAEGFYQEYRGPMCWRDVDQLSQEGHFISSHTMSHPILKGMDENSVKFELEKAKECLEKKLGRDVDWFAFPFGGLNYIDSEALRKIKAYYRINFTGLRGVVSPKTNPLGIPRCSIDINSPFLSMIGEALGVTNFIHKRKNHIFQGMLN